MSKDKKVKVVNTLMNIVPEIVEYLSMAGEDEVTVARSTFKQEPAIVAYVKSLAGEMEDEVGEEEDDTEEVILEMLDRILAILEKSIFDSDGNIPYDYMVEELLK
jgi:hypothetical protein